MLTEIQSLLLNVIMQNGWEPKTLSNFRKWSTLVHPRDIDENKSYCIYTKYYTSI